MVLTVTRGRKGELVKETQNYLCVYVADVALGVFVSEKSYLDR